MFDTPIVSFEPVENGFNLQGVHVLIDEDDFEGIHIAAGNLIIDLRRVSGRESYLRAEIDERNGMMDSLVLVGSVKKSRYIRKLVESGALDITKIEGKWESFMTQVLAVPWASNCLVIAGSDKRGAIFGIYSLCEQIGVSPCVLILIYVWNF